MTFFKKQSKKIEISICTVFLMFVFFFLKRWEEKRVDIYMAMNATENQNNFF